MTNVVFGICSVLFVGLYVFAQQIVGSFSNLFEILAKFV